MNRIGIFSIKFREKKYMQSQMMEFCDQLHITSDLSTLTVIWFTINAFISLTFISKSTILIELVKIHNLMSDNSIPFKNSSLSKVFFAVSIFCFVFWMLGQTIDVYHYAIVGAIFEILWLFMLLMLFVLPIVCFVFLVKEKYNLRSLYLYSIILSIGTLLLMIFIDK
jgi:hypothetical protein